MITKILQYSSILAGLFLPLLLVLVGGREPKSFSQYYFTPAAPLFVFFLLWISLGMMSVLTLSSVFRGGCLILVAVFDCHMYRVIHNLSAILFFLFSLSHILHSKRYRVIGYFMIGFSPICVFSLYYGELVQVLLISVYHFLYFNRLHQISIQSFFIESKGNIPDH